MKDFQVQSHDDTFPLPSPTARPGEDIGDVAQAADRFRAEIEETRSRISGDIAFYPYDTLWNFRHLDALLTGEHRGLLRSLAGGTVADIGGADGTAAFFLEKQGFQVDLIEWPWTNYNQLRGARALKDALRSSIEIHEVDLDSQFHLPRERYDLILFLGILYHLKNPYYVLQTLANCSTWCALSTRVARFTPGGATNLHNVPVAYLLDPGECNNDATNFWIFSEAGLRRILSRTGWDILDWKSVGNNVDSNPVDSDKDERVYCLLKSRYGISLRPVPALSAAPPGSGVVVDWDAGDNLRAEVHVSTDGGPDVLFARGSPGSQVAAWVQPGHRYKFKLYRDSEQSGSPQVADWP